MPMAPERYSLSELESLPTINAGWCGDLKVDTGRVRVWLYRVGLADGAPFEHTAQVEHLIDGRWTSVEFYNLDNPSEVQPA
jgi:hypothetical protein